jgi:hypothetical protein
MCFIPCILSRFNLSDYFPPHISHLFISSFIIYCSVCWIMLHFKDIDHNKHGIKALYTPMQFSKYVILNAIWFSQNWYSKTLGNSKRLNMLFIAFQTISFKSLEVLGQMPQNLWISTNDNPPPPPPPPRPLFNVVSHFSSGLMCFGLNNIDWGGGRGRGAVLWVKNCNDPLTS